MDERASRPLGSQLSFYVWILICLLVSRKKKKKKFINFNVFFFFLQFPWALVLFYLGDSFGPSATDLIRYRMKRRRQRLFYI